MNLKACRICGSNIPLHSKRRTLCSIKCELEAGRQRAYRFFSRKKGEEKSKPDPVYCLQCGKLIEKPKGPQKVHFGWCSVEHHRMLGNSWEENHRKPKYCLYCSEVINNPRHCQQIHDGDCRIKYFRDYRRKYRERKYG